MNPTGNASPCNGIGPTIAVVGINGWRCLICNTTFERSFSIEHHMIINHHPLPQELTVPITNTNATVACSDAASLGHSHLSTGTIHSDSAVNNLQDLILSKSDQTGRIEESVSQGQREVNMDVSGAPTKVCESLQRTNPVSETAEDNSSQGTILGSSRPSTASSETRETLADITTRALPDDVSMQQDRPVIVKKEPGVNILESDTTQPQGAGKSQTGGTQAAGERSVNEDLFSAPQHAACTWFRYQGAKNQNSPTSPQAKIPKMYPTSVVTEATFVHCKSSKRRVCSCGQAFDTKLEFRHHRRVVHCKLNQKIFFCPICNTQYQYKRGLNRHIAMKGQVAVACTECPQRFHDQASLESHRAAYHGTDSPVGQNNQPLVAKEERLNIQDVPRQGPYCRRGNNSHAGLMLPWECSKCKKHFPERPTFRKHLIECGILKFPDKHRTFECNLCGAAFQWLVPYYKHYINVHKTASLIQPTNSPAHFEPFHSLENSPANSPCPSMTSEINSALADVDLNTHGASNASGSCISSASTTDSSSKQISNVGMGELSIDDSWSLRSSNPQSLSSDAGSSDWTRDSDIIILSDPEGSVTVDSSSSDDSDEDWEVISGNSGKISDGAKPAPSEPVFPGVHMGGVFSSGAHHFPRPGFAPMRPPPPPPPPHPRHCFPPPPPHPPFPHFPPPPRHHHDHHHGPHHGHHHGGPFHGAGWGRFPHGRGMHGPWSMWGHGAFGGRGCFFEEHDEYDEETLGKKQSNASETSTKTVGTGSDPSEAHPPSSASRKEGEPSVPSEASSDGTSSSCPVPGAELFPWTGKTKEGKCAKKMIKQLFRSIIASYRQGRTFLFCPDCMQAFSEESDLDAHCKVTHSATSQYLCFLCQQGIKSPLEYNRHIRQHCQEFTQMRGRGCGRGGWMMGQKGGFRHLFKKLVKEGPSAFLPNMSPFAHGPHSVDSDQDLDDSESNPEHFNECPICFKKFRANSRENFFERHVNSHFGVETFNFKCEIDNCGKTFLEKAKFTAHQATHSAPQVFTCDDCGKSYLNKTSLTRHQRIHNGERPYKCSECGEGFIENRDLVRHRAVHTGESPFKCEECGTGFTLKASLLTHKRNKHQGLGPFTCTGCAQVFPSASALTRHHAVCSKSEGGDTKVEEGETESHQVKQEPADMDLD